MSSNLELSSLTKLLCVCWRERNRAVIERYPVSLGTWFSSIEQDESRLTFSFPALILVFLSVSLATRSSILLLLATSCSRSYSSILLRPCEAFQSIRCCTSRFRYSRGSKVAALFMSSWEARKIRWEVERGEVNCCSIGHSEGLIPSCNSQNVFIFTMAIVWVETAETDLSWHALTRMRLRQPSSTSDQTSETQGLFRWLEYNSTVKSRSTWISRSKRFRYRFGIRQDLTGWIRSFSELPRHQQRSRR